MHFFVSLFRCLCPRETRDFGCSRRLRFGSDRFCEVWLFHTDRQSHGYRKYIGRAISETLRLMSRCVDPYQAAGDSRESYVSFAFGVIKRASSQSGDLVVTGSL